MFGFQRLQLRHPASPSPSSPASRALVCRTWAGRRRHNHAVGSTAPQRGDAAPAPIPAAQLVQASPVSLDTLPRRQRRLPEASGLDWVTLESTLPVLTNSNTDLSLFGPRAPDSPLAPASAPAAGARNHIVASPASSRRYFQAAQPGTATAGGTATPLQRRLAEAGVPDYYAYDKPHHSTFSGAEEGLAEYVCKAAELCREGLTAEDVDNLLQGPAHSPWHGSFAGVFRPNLDYLRWLLVEEAAPAGAAKGLTPLGALLRAQPAVAARVLNRTPALLQELDQWVCGELGVARAEFAAAALRCPAVLRLSAESGRAVARFLWEEVGMSREEVVSHLLRDPATFALAPATLRSGFGWLQMTLGISRHSQALQLVLAAPDLLHRQLPELPTVLLELDRLLGAHGAGARLVMRAPLVASATVAGVRGAVASLGRCGFREEGVRDVVEAYPSVLVRPLEEGSLRWQKLEWAARELQLPFAKLVAGRFFHRSLHRMASRLAFVRHLGVALPPSLFPLGRASMAGFLSYVSKAAGRDVGQQEFDGFVSGWLESPQGLKYGSRRGRQ